MANSQKESGVDELPEAAYHLDLDRSDRWHHKHIISYILGLRSSGVTLVQVLTVFVKTKRVSEEKTCHL
ncbi:unnamed protein product [Sphagnum jensenii]|uniref:Uncharacterized protein n=1 Tax=Sphagnum jensenii TaxID=128206 RepID=A0ABP1BVD1_9BRYO